MSKKHATEALVVYKQFAQQTAKVVEFFDTAKRLQRVLGAEIPVLKHAPVSLVQALEEYVNQPNFEENRKSVQAKKKGSIPCTFDHILFENLNVASLLTHYLSNI